MIAKHIPVIFLIFSCCWSPFLLAEKGRVVTVAADTWCPFNCIASDKNQGFMVDIAKQALAFSGYKLKYKNINWARTKQMVKNGELDGLVGTSKGSAERTPYQFPKTSLGFSEVCLFKRTGDDWVYKNTTSLEQGIMGWINGYGFMHEPLDTWVSNNKGTSKLATVSGNSNLQQRLIDLLLLERIDYFAEDRFVIQYELKQMKKESKVKMAGCIGTKDSIYVAFSKKKPDAKLLAEALDSGFKRLRKNGQLGKILKKYGIQEQELISADQNN